MIRRTVIRKGFGRPIVTANCQSLGERNGDGLQRDVGSAQHESGDNVRWYVEYFFLFLPALAIVSQHLASFRKFPPRQLPANFSVERAIEKLRLPPSSKLASSP